jgi:hypothetical protein
VSTPALDTKEPWWTVGFTSIGIVGGKDVKNTNSAVTIVDSGTPSWVVPTPMFEAAGFGNINVASDCSNKKDLPNL